MKRARLAAVAAALGTLLLAGCITDRLVWAPDGSKALVITRDGLYVCAADGTLTSLLIPNAYRAAWLGDARHLVVARSRDAHSFAELKSTLGAARAAVIAANANLAWMQLQAGQSISAVQQEAGLDAEAEFVVLRERHPAGMEKLLGSSWNSLKNLPATVHELFSATLNGDSIEPGPRLYIGLAEVRDIRPAPDGEAVAFVTALYSAPNQDSDSRLMVAPASGAEAPLAVADHTADHPDWTPDSAALEYLQASNPSPAKDGLRLGTLVRRTIVDTQGRLEAAGAGTPQLGLIFQIEDRVRCLKDARVVFSASEFHLPMVASPNAPPREELFAFTPGSKPQLAKLIPNRSLAELPDALASFDISPDESRVLFGDNSGAVWLLTLATGRVEHVAPPSKIKLPGDSSGPNLFAPTWRTPGEFTFARDAVPSSGRAAPSQAEVVLRGAGKETELSAGWPQAVRDAFLR